MASSGVTLLTAEAALVRAGGSTAGVKPADGAADPALRAPVEDATPRPLSIFMRATLRPLLLPAP
jgi:hypothetical protein